MFRSSLRHPFKVLEICLLAALAVFSVEAKSIRLRNEVIVTDRPKARQAVAPSVSTQPVSGLYVVQFATPPQAEQRQNLAAAGIELMQYVPDDAFIARLRNVPLSKVLAQPGVVWAGKYAPGHKVHETLQGAAKARSANDSLEVSILLAPGSGPAEVQAARTSLSELRQESVLPTGTILRGTTTAGGVTILSQSEAVLWVEAEPKMKLFDEVSSKIVAGDAGPGKLFTQSLGYDGEGVTVAVADSGLDSGDTTFLHPDIEGRVRAMFHYGSPGQLEDAADEHSHGTHVAGIIAGNGSVGEQDENGFLYGLGVAPGASLIGQRIFDAAGGYAAPPSFERLTRDALRAGADVASNSWGDDTQGRYDLSAMEFDELVRDADGLAIGDQPYIIEFSAGNAGPAYRTVGSPAVAKNVIATGASQNDRANLPLEEFALYAEGIDAMTDFSSRGPCEDGRIKPDIVAPGSWIASLRSVFANDDFAWWPISDSYLYQGGTSQAGPHVSGAAAVFVQYWRATRSGATPSPALVKAALINSAADLDDAMGTEPVPNMDEGWGRLDLPALIGSTRNYDYVDQSVLLTNGAVHEQYALVGSANEPLKITVTYTDVPGSPAAVVALVNDLDLEVISPDGRVYRGNRFLDGESVPDVPGTDTINNVEAVHLLAPVPGEYLIRVRGRRVVEDARRDTTAVDQDFALVISGSFATPGTGIVTFDRAVYRVPDQIKLSLVDHDLAGQSSVDVLLRSGAEPAGEVIALQATGARGVYTGVVATTAGPAQPNGTLQVAHGNAIEAVYVDASASANRVFTAQADLQPPVIANLEATNLFGQITISWATDEEARSEVYYGTATPDAALTNRALEVTHEFALPAFPADTVVKFMVVSEDEAGNRSTNNNGGAFFTVISVQPSGFLLVDSYGDYTILGFPIASAPPLSGYTEALDRLGITYQVFSTIEGDLPTLAQLRSFRCVIWRISDLEAPSAPLAQLMTEYVQGGGSLLLASMEALTRFSEAGLASFNRDILRVQSYTEDMPVNEIAGVPGEPIGLGIDALALDYLPYEEILTLAGIADPSDWLVPNTNAAAAIQSGNGMVGLRSPRTGVDLPGRVVFLSFPLDAVPLGEGTNNNRTGLLSNILNFLAPPENSSALTLDSDVYSVPGRAIVELEDSRLKGQGTATVTVESPQPTEQLTLTLYETARRGLFRGSVIFVPTNSSAAGTLFVRANDTVQFEYHDATASIDITASAIIDTNGPVVTEVAIEPGYLEALVSWQTSKPADSVVQYGESPGNFPNNFTAYDQSLTTEHEVFLNGLKPDTTYYVRVTSRDRAGNTTTDDNGGALYTFRTLQPFQPPWFDDIETHSVEWSTFAPPESETEWTRGQPGNGETAHSGANCWGVNLGGGPLSLAEAYLVSPGIFLGGGNKATLRFWHNYDFLPQSEFEFGFAALQLITNITTSPILLAQMPSDASGGWEEFQFDLTPYIGNVVYVVWYYFLFSFEGPPRLAWLVDDASITMESVASGTVQVTNNIAQASYILSGPMFVRTNGFGMLISSAPPGQYTLEFADVPYHATPSSQTQTLAPGGTLVLRGQYTFPDANANGMSDLWESAAFGVVSPERNQQTDSDNDGMSDFAEFIAGTQATNAASTLQLSGQAQTNGTLTLSWPGVSGRAYCIESSTDAVNWQPATPILRSSADGAMSHVLPQDGAMRLYRLEVRP